MRRNAFVLVDPLWEPHGQHDNKSDSGEPQAHRGNLRDHLVELLFERRALIFGIILLAVHRGCDLASGRVGPHCHHEQLPRAGHGVGAGEDVGVFVRFLRDELWLTSESRLVHLHVRAVDEKAVGRDRRQVDRVEADDVADDDLRIFDVVLCAVPNHALQVARFEGILKAGEEGLLAKVDNGPSVHNKSTGEHDREAIDPTSCLVVPNGALHDDRDHRHDEQQLDRRIAQRVLAKLPVRRQLPFLDQVRAEGALTVMEVVGRVRTPIHHVSVEHGRETLRRRKRLVQVQVARVLLLHHLDEVFHGWPFWVVESGCDFRHAVDRPTTRGIPSAQETCDRRESARERDPRLSRVTGTPGNIGLVWPSAFVATRKALAAQVLLAPTLCTRSPAPRLIAQWGCVRGPPGTEKLQAKR